MRIVILSLLSSGLVLAAGVQTRAAAPPAVPACTTATAACTRWIALGAGRARSMVYATRPLDAPNPSIRRALVMVHGTGRNADHYFQTATTAAFLAGALDDTIVVAPRLASADGSCKDALAADEVSWSCGGNSWRAGGNAVSHPELTSFDFVDEILRQLAKKTVFPNLAAVVVAGHSAGGQFVARYAMANRVHDSLGVPVTYVVANPSSYAWPDATRPLAVDDAAPDAARDAWNSDRPHTAFRYGPFDAAKAPTYDRWPYGLAQRTGGYTKDMTEETLKRQLISRPVTYLVGQLDILPLAGFDASPNAMAQGPTRRARGEAFAKYVNEVQGARHAIRMVPLCGHNDRCVYTTDVVLPLIFPQP